MKELRSIFSVLMAMLIFSVSAGLSISQHFCKGNLWDSSLFAEAPDCGMEVTEHPVADHSITSFSEKPCCEKQLLTVNIKDTTTLLKAQKGDNPVLQAKFLAVFSSVFLYVLPVFEAQDTWVAGYSPPLIEKDIPLLIQSFLI